jgi:PAS domain S-box-containing protein
VPTARPAGNDVAHTMLGYAVGDWEPNYGQWERLVHPDDIARAKFALQEHLEGRAPEYRCETRLLRKDGGYTWILDIGRVIVRDPGGRALRALGVHLDVSAAREARAALEAARIEADLANAAKSEFLANMSHEIRTPMTAILGFADELTEQLGTASPGRQAEYLATIKRNGQHLLTIINDILDLSKIEAGRMSVERVAVDPAQILRAVESMTRSKAEAKGLALEFHSEKRLPAHVRTDAVRVQQILVNLIGNAIKFTEHGSVTVRVAATCGAGGEPLLRFEVVDTGIGMRRDEIDRLFAPFQQADSSSTRRFGGTGLGLRIAKMLAIQLGGDVTVISEPGRGSTFVATIHAEPVTPDSQLDRAAPISPAGGRDLSGQRIFLAEDGRDNQRLISLHLRKAGAIVTVFPNGLKALEALTADGTVGGPLALPGPCDILISDMQMPEMDGYTLSRMLRAKGFARPIVALTANAMAGDAEDCLAAGCDAYATKPIDRPRLVAVCHAAMEKQRAAAS